jgi:hypothetical protein
VVEVECEDEGIPEGLVDFHRGLIQEEDRDPGVLEVGASK